VSGRVGVSLVAGYILSTAIFSLKHNLSNVGSSVYSGRSIVPLKIKSFINFKIVCIIIMPHYMLRILRLRASEWLPFKNAVAGYTINSSSGAYERVTADLSNSNTVIERIRIAIATKHPNRRHQLTAACTTYHNQSRTFEQAPAIIQAFSVHKYNIPVISAKKKN